MPVWVRISLAVCSAVWKTRFKTLPVTPEKILQALDEKKKE